jgi:hypothetical protein
MSKESANSLVREAFERQEVERSMWAAWNASGAAARDAGRLVDREIFDERTYLMLVDARDKIAKAMKREGFR